MSTDTTCPGANFFELELNVACLDLFYLHPLLVALAIKQAWHLGSSLSRKCLEIIPVLAINLNL